MSGISEVRATVNAVGKGSVEIDGVEMADKLVGYTVQCEQGNLPIVTLFPAPMTQNLTIDAEVVIARMEDVPEWLDTLDPDMLATLAIETGKPTAEGFIEAIKELWRGR